MSENEETAKERLKAIPYLQLRTVADELNEVLGLQPKIDARASRKVIEGALLEVLPLIEPEDALSDMCREVLDAIKEADTGGVEISNTSKETLTKDGVTSARVFGATRKRTTIMDRVLVRGGKWRDLADEVNEILASVGMGKHPVFSTTLKEHLRARIRAGFLDAEIYKPLEITFDDRRVTVRVIEEEVPATDYEEKEEDEWI